MFWHVLTSEIVGRCFKFNTRNNLWSLKFKVDTWLTISIACIAAQWHDGEIWVLATRHRCRRAMDRWIQMCSDSVQIGSSVRYPLDSDVFFKYATKTAQRLEMIRLKISNLFFPSRFVLNVLGNCNLQLCLHDVTNMLRQEVVPLPSSRRRSRQRSNYKYITSNTGETLKPFKKVSKYQESWITKIHIQNGKHFVLKANLTMCPSNFMCFLYRARA